MRFISTRIHGYIDYIVGAVLVLAPFIFGFATGGAEMWVPIVLGLGIIVYSLLTDYELGVFHSIAPRTHLVLDGLVGVVLAVSPWLFGFSAIVWLPHLLVGLALIGLAVFTEQEAVTTRRSRRRPLTRTA